MSIFGILPDPWFDENWQSKLRNELEAGNISYSDFQRISDTVQRIDHIRTYSLYGAASAQSIPIVLYLAQGRITGLKVPRLTAPQSLAVLMGISITFFSGGILVARHERNKLFTTLESQAAPVALRRLKLAGRQNVSTSQAGAKTPSRWDEIRSSNVPVRGSAWDAIRQRHERVGLAKQTPNAEPESSQEPDRGSEQARFDALLEAERKMGQQHNAR